MMFRTEKFERARHVALACAFLAPIFLAACSTTPRTSLDWDVRDSFARPHKARIYASRVAPAVRPREKPPGWYTQTARQQPPAHYDEVQPAQIVTAPGLFSWPVSGRVISNFGANESGERNDGINIAAAFGEPIHAAASGTVSYTGNELKGYGNLVLIRHDDGYVTAYAHAERILVERGDRGVKGQVIAYAGETGDVTSPQVHFEIRHGVEPVNPRTLMMASSRL